jgi:DNA polymerase (family 10)
LNDLHARRAKELGIPIAINTDAHTVGQLDYMRFGVSVARRGWLTPADILNTQPEKQLVTWLERKRSGR